MAKKKETTKKGEKKETKKSQPKKKAEKKYTLVELVNDTTIPNDQLMLMLVDSGYFAKYKKELEEANPKASLTKSEFRKQILRRD